MERLAHYALIGTIIASALGGVVTSVLVMRYGLLPSLDEEPPEATQRRVFATHLGHALSAVAFAVAATLAAVALFAAAPAPATRAEPEDMKAIARRLEAVEDAVRRVADTLERTVEGRERLQEPSAAPR